jgi:polyhydroxybutyrate depolymerase
LTLTSNNTERSYWLYLPTTYSPDTPVPLIISFHGFGSDAPGQQALSGLSFLAETGNFIVAYPNGLNNEWLDGPKSRDITFTRDLITQLEMDYAIDAKRIFVTGMSNGGGMTNRVGCDMADVVAAIASVAGAYNAWELCDPSRPLPVLAFHGLADNVVPFEGAGQEHMLPPIRDWAAAWAGRNGCAADPVVDTPGNGLTIETWGSCEAEVILYSIPNFGHSWPGTPLRPLQATQTVNASQRMWEFFQAHPLP